MLQHLDPRSSVFFRNVVSASVLSLFMVATTSSWLGIVLCFPSEAVLFSAGPLSDSVEHSLRLGRVCDPATTINDLLIEMC